MGPYVNLSQLKIGLSLEAISHGRCIRNIAALLAAVMLGGCGGIRVIPEQWISVSQAFPSKASMNPPPNSSEAQMQTMIPVAYSDVFRTAFVALTQAQLNVERRNEKEGWLLATRLTKRKWVGIAREPTDHRYFYAVRVDEITSRSTRVTISAKVQGRCAVGNDTTLAIASLGLSTLVTKVGESKLEVPCEVHASGQRWATGYVSTAEELQQFISFLKNNLVAQGLM